MDSHSKTQSPQKPSQPTSLWAVSHGISSPYGAEVRQLLDSCGIRYWVSENAISLDGAPEVTEINLGREGDAAVVQAILDSVG